MPPLRVRGEQIFQLVWVLTDISLVLLNPGGDVLRSGLDRQCLRVESRLGWFLGLLFGLTADQNSGSDQPHPYPRRSFCTGHRNPPGDYGLVEFQPTGKNSRATPSRPARARNVTAFG